MIYDVNIPQTLNTQVIPTIFSASWQPPSGSISLPKPLSYQFQVVEYTDDHGKVVKVELQVQQTEHDQSGSRILSSGFKPVPRIKMPLP